MSAMLEVKDLEVSYGKIKAVKGISFTVEEGEVVTLIGTNGAGKTTTLRTISGLLRPVAGSITFQGKDLTTVPGLVEEVTGHLAGILEKGVRKAIQAVA